VLSYKFSFVCGQDLYLIRIYAIKFDKHARKCVFLTNLYHILACASKFCKQNARCIGALKVKCSIRNLEKCWRLKTANEQVQRQNFDSVFKKQITLQKIIHVNQFNCQLT
jgi:hypothetical protein